MKRTGGHGGIPESLVSDVGVRPGLSAQGLRVPCRVVLGVEETLVGAENPLQFLGLPAHAVDVGLLVDPHAGQLVECLFVVAPEHPPQSMGLVAG